jgi:hypothetical protein
MRGGKIILANRRHRVFLVLAGALALVSAALVGLMTSLEENHMHVFPAPHELDTLTLYDIDGFLGKDLDKATLAKTAHVTVDRAMTERMFERVEHRKGRILWKGNCLGIITFTNGTKEHLVISYYGGFFKILGRPGYYKITGESRRVFEDQMRAILANSFIPARQHSMVN